MKHSPKQKRCIVKLVVTMKSKETKDSKRDIRYEYDVFIPLNRSFAKIDMEIE